MNILSKLSWAYETPGIVAVRHKRSDWQGNPIDNRMSLFIGDFHFPWEALGVCVQYLWGSEGLKGSLCQLKDICLRRQVDKAARNFRPSDEFLTQVWHYVYIHIWDCPLIKPLYCTHSSPTSVQLYMWPLWNNKSSRPYPNSNKWPRAMAEISGTFDCGKQPLREKPSLSLW